ncbi:MAG: hypothetical protein AAF153_01405 [Pseudomonadota bacterium]
MFNWDENKWQQILPTFQIIHSEMVKVIVGWLFIGSEKRIQQQYPELCQDQMPLMNQHLTAMVELTMEIFTTPFMAPTTSPKSVSFVDNVEERRKLLASQHHNKPCTH